MSSNVQEFFEILGDSSVFISAFKAAQDASLKFGADFKATATSVEADAQRMQLAMVNSLSGSGSALAATSPQFRAQANAALNARLASYGAPGGAGATGAVAGGGLSFNGLLGAAAIITSILAPLGLLADGLLRGAENYASMSAAVLRNSEAIGMNAQDLQAWEKIASIAGIDSQSMVLDFERFSKNLAEGAPGLKATGVTLAELGITSTNAGTAILQLSDYFHTHTDQAEKAAIATALFGRSGSELIPILDQGSAAVSKYKDQLEAMGVILSSSDLIIGAQAQSAIQNFSEAVDGAKNRLIGAALPGFTVFFQTLSAIMQDNANFWVQIGNAIGNVVLFISGLVAGVAGVDLSTLLAPADAGAAFQGLGQGANDAASGIDNAARATKAQTDALTDQISALQAQKRAQDEVYDNQKSALQDQLDNLKDVNDSRRHSGEDLISYERRLEELGIQDKIKAIDKAKTTYDRTVDDHIAALEREKQAVSQAAGAMGASLTAGGAAGALGLNKALSGGLSQAETNILTWSHKVGQDLSWLFSPDAAKASAAWGDLGSNIGTALVQGMGRGIVNADTAQAGWVGSFIAGIGAAGMSAGENAGQWLRSLITGPGYAMGTISTRQHLAMISEGNAAEAVLPLNNPGRSLALMEQSGLAALARSAGGNSGGNSGGGSGPSIVINFNGPVADELVASRVVARIDKKMRDRGYTNRGSFGS
jgi:hypothetical protein